LIQLGFGKADRQRVTVISCIRLSRLLTIAPLAQRRQGDLDPRKPARRGANIETSASSRDEIARHADVGKDPFSVLRNFPVTMRVNRNHHVLARLACARVRASV
jgi:hypothetical protein